MKVCRWCGADSTIVEFPSNRLICKPCRRAYEAAWRAANPERVKRNGRRCAARYAERHPSRIEAHNQASYARHSEVRKAESRAWRAANPEKHRIQEARRRARKRAATVYPISYANAAERWRYFGGNCWMCGREADTWDHVIALVRGGPHVLSNLRPACRSCNSRKGHRTPTASLRRPFEGAA